MASIPAIRFVAASTKSTIGNIHLCCHVKPGTKQRDGVISISDSIIEVCISAPAVQGQANKAVREAFSEILKCTKSDVEVIRGLKSLEETVTIAGIDTKGDEQRYLSMIRDQLENAVE